MKATGTSEKSAWKFSQHLSRTNPIIKADDSSVNDDMRDVIHWRTSESITACPAFSATHEIGLRLVTISAFLPGIMAACTALNTKFIVHNSD